MLKHINGSEYKELLKKDGVSVVDFFATWCGPCRMLSPILEELADSEKIDIYKVDVDENQDLARENVVMVVPTILFIKNGEVVQRKEGLLDRGEILSIVKEISK